MMRFDEVFDLIAGVLKIKENEQTNKRTNEQTNKRTKINTRDMIWKTHESWFRVINCDVFRSLFVRNVFTTERRRDLLKRTDQPFWSMGHLEGVEDIGQLMPLQVAAEAHDHATKHGGFLLKSLQSPSLDA